MRALAVASLTALAVLVVHPHAASEPATKQVEVTNSPAVQDVNVTNELVITPARFQLVGFTSGTFLGDFGFFGAVSECQEEFADSRLCTTVEVARTVRVPVGLAGAAWVQPEYVGGQSDAMDLASGLAAAGGGVNCRGWTQTTGARGFSVTAGGAFGSESCGSDRRIACCALVP